jgi:hypothetical protein
MSNIPITNLRLVGRNSDFLNRKTGQRGEVFFDQQQNKLRLYDGNTAGGFSLAREDQTVAADLSNVSNAVFKSKAESAGVIGGATINENPPTSPQFGQLWFDTDNAVLYVYYNDGTSNQWVQPASIQYGGPGGGGSGGANTLNELTDVTISSPSSGQVLKYNGIAWINDTDAVGEGGGQASNSFSTISVSGQSNVVADSTTDTLTLIAGTNITITTNATTDAITISAASSGGGASEFSLLSEVSTSSLRFDQIYLPCLTSLRVTNVGASAYQFDQYSGNNPTIYAINATTIAFDLNVSGHPFLIQDPTGTNYNTGLTHVTPQGVVSTGSSAQGKTSGTLYWKIPSTISGNYRYQCSLHSVMIGTIVVKNFVSI